MEKHKIYDITQCALYKCPTRKRLATYLKIDYKYMMSKKYISYRTRLIDKKDTSEKRVLTVPINDDLKKIQRRIHDLLQPVIRPEWLMSSTKGKSYIDNGKTHIKAKYALMMDIEKFYDKCTREYVYRFFTEKLLTAPDVATILTDIVTYNGKLPTGSSTSQILAYYAYEDMFSEIEYNAKTAGCIFTLLVDDTTTSSENPFNKDKLYTDACNVMKKYGHNPKHKKTRYYSKDKPKPITGTIITIDNKLDVPNRLRSQIYEKFQKNKTTRNSGIDIAEFSHELTVLNGQVQAARNVKPGIYQDISRTIKDWQYEILKSNEVSLGMVQRDGSSVPQIG